MNNALQAFLVVFAVATITTTGAKKTWGWLIGVASEGVWAAYAYVIHSWGLAVLCLVYGGLYGRNYFRWRALDRQGKGPR